MKIKLLFLVKLLFFSILFFILQPWLAKVYQFTLLLVCSLLLPPEQNEINLSYDSFVRTVPFLALMCATPRIGLAKRIFVMAGGMAVFVGIDVMSILLWGQTPGAGSTVAHLVSSQIWRTTGQWILPFLLWFLSVQKNIGELFKENT